MQTLLSQRILVLDGAMGTMIQRYHLTEADFRGDIFSSSTVKLQGNNDLIALTRPDVLHEIHRAYLEAGADIIETNTFNAQRISQADYHTEDYVVAINRAAARIAREEADRMTALTPDRPRFVAASIGPTNRTLSMSPDVENPAFRALSFDDLCTAYEEQMQALAEEGVDLYLIETIFDTLNTKAALQAAQRVSERTGHTIPVMLSVTIADASGRTLSGQTLSAFLTSISHDAQVISVGLNCSFGANDMRPYLRELSALATSYYISAHPNAGLPNEEGVYTETPESMAAAIARFIDDGSVNIVGGCCGSTPEHIRAIAAKVYGRQPRQLQDSSQLPWLAGLEGFTPLAGSFINVGERCNVAGSRKFLRLIKEKQYDEALAIARKQVRDGALLLDLNMDDGLLDTETEMVHFLRLMASDPEVARVPWMIDSSRFSVIESALKCVQGKAVVNSISLKEGEALFVEHARTIRRYGAAMVVMAFDEEGQATTFERKVAVCNRAYRLLTEEANVPPTDIIFDPNILTVATGMKEHDRYGLDFIRATEWIRIHLPGAHVSGGVSNLSFAFRGNNYLREAMHAVFLYHAIAKGMDMGIVNPASKVMYHDLPADLLERIEDVILYRREDAAERLTEAAEKLLAKATQNQTEGTKEAADETTHRSLIALDERLITALRTGDDEFLEADLQEALQQYASPGAIIEGPLMQGMELVGVLFGEGKMFLPQVVKSARTMKKAVALLQPYLEKDKQTGTPSQGHYVVATVKGDVHDIGKNIVAVVLGCNHFEVTDLGVMVPAEQIVETIQREHADFVSLSGLITPSLDEMCHTAKALNEAGIRIPLFIGGATTSDLHTALKIAPLYEGPVFHVKDASQNPVLALQLKGPQREQLLTENRQKQRELVAAYEARKAQESSSSASPISQRLRIDWSHEELPRPTYLGCRTFRHIPIAEVRELINWIYFFKLWKVRPGTPEAEAVKQEAEQLLDELQTRHSMLAQVGFYPATGQTDRIVIHPVACTEAEGTAPFLHNPQEALQIPTPRQTHSAEKEEPCLSLCDFVAPEGYQDYIGAFAVTISPSFVEELEATKQTDDYRALLLQSVGDRLAEATSEWIHREVRRTLWGYAPDENWTLSDLARAAYRGIRPAVGYPSLPDQRQLFQLAQLLNLPEIGIQLTENGAMYPQSSICGLLFASPHARYFAVSRQL